MSTVELTNVIKSYGNVRAVDQVSLTVKAGELVTIVGPSGSGKSTILSLIAGISEPTGGAIYIAGRDVTWVGPEKRNVGLVFQSYALFPHMTIFENVAFPLRIRRLPEGEIRQRVSETLGRVQLTELARRRPSQISGGQQQRVALARAIVFKPDILLLDEPLAALDRKLREEVRIEIRRLQRSLGITTVLVTHDQDEALSMADKVVVLSNGKVQQIGSPDTVYKMPANRFVAEFLGIANVFAGKFQASAGGHSIQLPNGERIACQGSNQRAAAEVHAILRPEQINLVETSKGKMEATIVDVVFFGDSARYVVTTKSGSTIVAQKSNPKSSFGIGANIALDWDPDDVWLLPEGV